MPFLGLLAAAALTMTSITAQPAEETAAEPTAVAIPVAIKVEEPAAPESDTGAKV